MFGIRVLIYLLGVGLVVWILYRLYNTPSPASKPPRKVGDMVKCDVCGIFIPRNEAFTKGEHCFCSKEHRDQPPQ